MFSPDALIAKIDAAEQLAAKIDTLDGEQKTLCIYRWAIVADEATGLAICAEEVLSPAELANLQKRLQKNGADLWARYRDNPRRFKQITGSEPWEQT